MTKDHWTGCCVIKQNVNSVEVRAVGLAAMLLGIPVKSSSFEGLSDHAQTLKDGALPVGSVEFVRRAMAVMGADEPANMSYPEPLLGFLGRSVEKVNAASARGRACFVKPCSTKAFTGFMFDPATEPKSMGEHEREQREAFMSLGDLEPVWMGPRVDFLAEWRAYVHGSELLGLERYDPDGLDDVEEPSPAWMRSIIDAWAGSEGAPAASAIDVGRLSSGEMVLVEVNDAWALGLYGRSVDPKAYLSMLGARWGQIMNGPALDGLSSFAPAAMVNTHAARGMK